MHELLEQLLASNQFLQGGLLLGALGIAVAYARRIPALLSHIIQRLWTVSLVVRDETLIQWMSHWLAISEYGQRNRWLVGHTQWADSKLFSVLGPGYGMHRFFYKGTIVWLQHELEDQGIRGKVSVLNVKTLGRNTKAIRSLINEAIDLANEEQFGRTPIFINNDHGNWYRINTVAKRPSASVFLKRGLMETILGDAAEFLDTRNWYNQRGIPYRRGYLLYGPPGNGKTTIIRALASELNLPIYALVLSGEDLTDDRLANALGRVPDPCVVVLEDFEKLNLEKTNITMSGLLNAIDGPLASEGRILILTANDISTFHPSLLRPGRIDEQWEILNPDEQTVATYVDTLFPQSGGNGVIGEAMDKDWSMADLQHRLVSTKGLPND